MLAMHILVMQTCVNVHFLEGGIVPLKPKKETSRKRRNKILTETVPWRLGSLRLVVITVKAQFLVRQVALVWDMTSDCEKPNFNFNFLPK